jgi:DNA-binding NarL/FixJ family response regulator
MGLRCFIVDDSTDFLDAARSRLESDGVTVVGVASTIDEALARLDRAEPDVVLVDVNLGSESGLDLARRIQTETNVDPAQVVLISTHAAEDLIDLVESVPAAALLSKTALSGVALRRILDDG